MFLIAATVSPPPTIDIKDFDFVFASSIDYVFDDQSYAEFLKSVFDFGVSEFLLTEIFARFQSILHKFLPKVFHHKYLDYL